MTNIVAIEFCALQYPDVGVCKEWVKKSILGDLIDFKYFVLRKRKESMFLTDEKKRPVWTFRHGLFKWENLSVVRPESTIVIVERGPIGGAFPRSALPSLTAENAKKYAEKEQKIRERLEKNKTSKRTKSESPPKKRKARTAIKEHKEKKAKKLPKIKKEPVVRGAPDDLTLNIDDLPVDLLQVPLAVPANVLANAIQVV